MLEQADQTNGTIRHHEEHGNDLGHRVDVTQRDENETDGAGDDGGNDRLVVGFPPPLEPQADGLWENSIQGQSLQGAWRDDDAPERAGNSGSGQPIGISGGQMEMDSM